VSGRPGRSCVHERFAEQVRRGPHRLAVRFEGHSLTYSQLDARANRLAHNLMRLGVGPDVPVGLCIERSLDLPAAMLGIFRAGGAYLPLDPTYPPSRLTFMLEDAGSSVLVTERHLLEAFPGCRQSVVLMDGQWGSDPMLSESAPTTNVGGHHLAYVIYTSGSTGVPKGVLMEHRSASNVLDNMARIVQASPGDVVLAVSTLAFDIACLDVFLPLSVGGQVVVVSREDAMFGYRIAEWLTRTEATIMQATPATWRLLLDSGWAGSPSLKMVSTGEVLTRELAEALLHRGGRLWNAYSTTESGIYATVHEVGPGDSPVPVGRPIDEVSVHVLDQDGAPAASGTKGEIHIGGAGPARGYLNRPDLTNREFVPDPFADTPGARMYRTGDLGRWCADGSLEYIGRIDHRFKVRGHRVEPGEIEAALATHPDVAQAVVVGREDEFGQLRPFAYVVPAVGAAVRPLDLRRYVMDRLPPYMVPAAVVVLDALPLTPNRKVDRLALPAP
jgi:amino acid adenylation domain-containing protein